MAGFTLTRVRVGTLLGRGIAQVGGGVHSDQSPCGDPAG